MVAVAVAVADANAVCGAGSTTTPIRGLLVVWRASSVDSPIPHSAGLRTTHAHDCEPHEAGNKTT